MKLRDYFGKIITLGTSFGENNNLNTFHGFKCLSVMFGTQMTHLDKPKVEKLTRFENEFSKSTSLD